MQQGGNERYAVLLFERVSWQSPYTLVDEDLNEGEIFRVGDEFVFADELGSFVPELNIDFTDEWKSNLEHEVINQFEADFSDQDFDSMSELLQVLMKDRKNIVALHSYLSDTGQKNFVEGLTLKRY